MSPLIWLAVGAFAIGTETFVIAGILPDIAKTLDVPVETSGHLVTAFALVYAISSPILSTLLGNMPRRRLLLIAMGGFTLANLLAAFAPSFWLLLLARIVLGACAGLIMPTANAIAVALAPPERRARALALVGGGLTVAMTLGVPLGNAVSTIGNWRYSFLLVAALGAVAFLGFATGLPRVIPSTITTLAQRATVARRPGILRALLMTYFWATGVFAFFTYFAVFINVHAGVSGFWLSAFFMLNGACGALGNSWGGRLADRFTPIATLRASLASYALASAALAAIALLVSPESALLLMVAGFCIWSVIGWSVNAPQASRLVGLAPDSPSVALSLNASALYLGTASGAVLGSLTLTFGASWQLALVSGVCQILAVATLLGRASPARSESAAS